MNDLVQIYPLVARRPRLAPERERHTQVLSSVVLSTAATGHPIFYFDGRVLAPDDMLVIDGTRIRGADVIRLWAMQRRRTAYEKSRATDYLVDHVAERR